MNKYKQFKKSDKQDDFLHSFEREELTAARMYKPGYRRKMRHTNNKHTRNAKNTSH